MPVVENIIVNVGTAVAKLILKFWLKESGKEQAADASNSLLEVLQTKTSDVLAQQRARRQFESIGERVALSLLPIFDREGAGIDDEDREAIVTTLAETLDKTVISQTLFPDAKTDPATLAKSLFAGSPGPWPHFSVAGYALYRRLISEVSQSIVDIAAELPAVNDNTIADVLKRSKQFEEIVERTLAEAERIRKISEQANQDDASRRFEADYRREVVRALDRLELFGIDLPQTSQRHRLSVAYVTLTAKQKVQIPEAFPDEFDAHERRNSLVVREGRADEEDTPEDEEEEDWEIVSVDEALASSRCLLIRGLAGSGKTTLLQWIAVRSATQDFEAHLGDWNATLPFFIRLRQFSHADLPQPESFPGLIAPSLETPMPDGWVTDQLTAGRGVVLIDGVDEVPEARRATVRTWIEDMVTRFPQSRFLVTARPHAFEEGWLNPERFADVELQPMELSNVSKFIDHWQAAAHEVMRDERDKTQLKERMENLKTEVRTNRAIRNLATNPLLCAMFCILYNVRRGKIPNDRVELYQACCEMLIHRRDLERDVDMSDYPALTYRQKRALLDDLAYWMIREGLSQVSFEDAGCHIAPKVDKLRGLKPRTQSAQVLKLLTERTGILREPVKGQVDFTHRTFEEFLAAQAALDQNDIEILLENAHNDQWREVIILAAGLARGDVGERIITGLLQQGDANPSLRHSLHLLAVACMESAVELSPETIVEVQERLKKLVPPKNMADAAALASAGDLAIPYLVAGAGQKANIAVACVRTLARIGGESALDVLTGYAKDSRQTVLEELIKSKDRFDHQEYVQRVLTPMFQMHPIVSLRNLSILASLESVNIPIGINLSNLYSLTDLSPLTGLTNLTNLNITYCPELKDLSPLAGLTNLTNLNLSYCYSLTDLSPLTGLTNLTNLNLTYCHRLTDLSPLAGLTNLTNLDLTYCNSLINLSPLVGLTNLKIFGRVKSQIPSKR